VARATPQARGGVQARRRYWSFLGLDFPHPVTDRGQVGEYAGRRRSGRRIDPARNAGQFCGIAAIAAPTPTAEALDKIMISNELLSGHKPVHLQATWR